ncbi:MAG: response regulator, partial [Gemmatimonadota bacterium]
YTTILSHFDFHVLDAVSGEEALQKVAIERPDIILLDISIPGIDGWTVASRLKDADETRDIPIIALTAHALPEHEERAREVGCDGYLAKPVGLHRMLEEIRRFVKEPD